MDDRVYEKEKPKQKRYTSLEDIDAVINECITARSAAEQAAHFCRKMSEKYSRDACKATNGAAGELIVLAEQQLASSAKHTRRAERIDKKLLVLKRARASFQTQDMFGDQGTVLDL